VTAVRPQARRLPAGPLLAAALPALLVSIATATAVGPASLGVLDVLAVVRAQLGFGESGVSRIAQGIVWDLRLPRTLLAAICGAGLAVCGAVLQSLLRNPLADPFLLGVSAGA
jgi:iron complex transport system permease protein